MPTGTVNLSRFRSIDDTSKESRTGSPSYDFSIGREPVNNVDLAMVESVGYFSGDKKNELDGSSAKQDEGQHTTQLKSFVESLEERMSLRSRAYQNKGALALIPLSPRKLSKRRSCELTSKMSPCIEKATFHLYQLQDIISGRTPVKQSQEDQLDHDAFSRPSHMPALPGRRGPGRIQLKPIRRNSKELPPLTELEEMAEASQTQILGAGYVIPDPTDVALMRFAQDVIEEHLLLLGRLETDRYNTEQSLIFERERVKKLREKIEALAYQRMCELPVAVQREHEACLMDIQELKWHVVQKARKQSYSEEKVRQVGDRQKELVSKILYMEENSPAVEQKLREDRETMAQIRKLQENADEELHKGVLELEEVDRRYQDASNRTTREKNVLNAGLDMEREHLRKIYDAINECQVFFDNYLKQLAKGEGRMEACRKELEEAENKLKEVIEVDNQKREELGNLKDSIGEQAKEKQILIAENRRLEQERKEQIFDLEAETARLEHELKKAITDLPEAVATNRTMEREMREIKASIAKFRKKEMESIKAKTRAEQDAAKFKGELESIEEESFKLRQDNAQLKINLATSQENFKQHEDSLRKLIESNNKQLRDESRARTVLQAKVSTQRAEFLKSKEHASQRHEKAAIRVMEITTAVEALQGQVKKLDKAHSNRQKVLAELQSLISAVKAQHELTERELSSQISALEANREKLTDELEVLKKSVDDMIWRSSAMDKKMSDIEASGVMMSKVMRSHETAISELNEEIAELKTQQETWQQMRKKLEDSKKDVTERHSEAQKKHEAHLANRNAILAVKEKEVQEALATNQILAQRYDLAQRLFMSMKHEFLLVYEKELLSENNLRDQEVLCQLHTQLRQALESFYQLRGLRTKADLNEFERRNRMNGERLGQIQEEMQQTTDRMARFLVASQEGQQLIWLNARQQTPAAT